MGFDPNLPADHTKAKAAEMRGQFNALKDITDEFDTILLAHQTQIAGLQSENAAQAAQITALQQQLASLMLVLTADSATMCLVWNYYGQACDSFHIFVHQPSDAPGVFNDSIQVAGDMRNWASSFDGPGDAVGYEYYVVPMDVDGNPLTPPSNTVSFANA